MGCDHVCHHVGFRAISQSLGQVNSLLARGLLHPLVVSEWSGVRSGPSDLWPFSSLITERNSGVVTVRTYIFALWESMPPKMMPKSCTHSDLG